MKLPNFVVRVLAGAVFVALLVGGICINQYTFLGVFALLTGLSLYEFYGLMEGSAKVPLARKFNTVGGILLFVGVFVYLSGICRSLWVFTPYLIFYQILFVSELYLKRENAIKSLAYSTLGQFYIVLPFILLNVLVFCFTNEYTPIYILAVLIFIWVNDSFAYLTGMAFGKRKLFERISPKKSWEGFIGGAFFSMLSSIAFHKITDTHSVLIWIGFAAITVVAGTFGDLIESLIKRTLQVKDSGNTIPGHGGLLDRLDSTIFAIPAIVVYLALVSCL